MLTPFLLLVLGFFSCQKSTPMDPNGPEEPAKIPPSQVVLKVTIQGATPENPFGDGSGTITCRVTAQNAVRYSFRFGTGREIESTTGEVTYRYVERGTAARTVTVLAFSAAGLTASASQEIQLRVEPTYSLVWSDEFNSGVSPDDAKWTYDIGTGSNGWGNNESQFYTNRPTNVSIDNGVLRIRAQRESFSGSNFTSARIKTQNRFSFTYGKVEVRAKLPTGRGTWPAIWMLGNNITSVGWPACGEIDIMEHVGNGQDVIHHSLHTPSSFGATQNTFKSTIPNVSSQFQVYEVEWTEESIVFSVNGQVKYTYKPTNRTAATWPFDAPQFIILNVAMGGTFGGAIDPSFQGSTMEVDYVRVYQVK